jgi:hypothetical protein
MAEVNLHDVRSVLGLVPLDYTVPDVEPIAARFEERAARMVKVGATDEETREILDPLIVATFDDLRAQLDAEHAAHRKSIGEYPTVAEREHVRSRALSDHQSATAAAELAHATELRARAAAIDPHHRHI